MYDILYGYALGVRTTYLVQTGPPRGPHTNFMLTVDPHVLFSAASDHSTAHYGAGHCINDRIKLQICSSRLAVTYSKKLYCCMYVWMQSTAMSVLYWMAGTAVLMQLLACHCSASHECIHDKVRASVIVFVCNLEI